MSFLSKLCNDYESRVQDSADVTVGSLSDADLREAVHSVLGDNYRLVNIVRRSGDIELQLESERDGTVYQYSYFEPGHVLVDDFKRELSATKLRPVSSYKKKVGDSKVRRRAQDSEDVWPYHNTEDPEEARLELEKMFDVYVPASGMADTLGGELLRAYVRLLYRCENDGDVPFEGYGNITCNSSWRFLANYFVNVLGRRDVLNVSSDWKKWNRTLIDFAPELLSVLNADDGALFRKPNNVDSREATEEDYEAERAEWDEAEDLDDDYIYDSAGHRCKKCDEGKLSENRRSVSDSEDLDGWYKGDSGHMIADLYVKEYDNMPDMKILGIRESEGGPVEYFRVSARLLDDLGFDDLENTLYFTKFDSLSEAAGVADRIAEAHGAFYKSLSDIIEK